MKFFLNIFCIWHDIFFTSIFSNEFNKILFKKSARVYNFDYNPNYGMIYGDYNSVELI